MTAFGEEAIKSVSVTVTSSVEAEADEGTVSATANSSKYRVLSCDFANSRGRWKAGETPKVTIELEAEEGYYFSSINAGKATVKGAAYSLSLIHIFSNPVSDQPDRRDYKSTVSGASSVRQHDVRRCNHGIVVRHDANLCKNWYPVIFTCIL